MVTKLALMFVLAVGAMFAQWPDYPSGGAAKKLEGPVPKAADGLPDLTGVWGFRNPGRGQQRLPGFPAPQATIAQGAPPPEAPRDALPLTPANGPPNATFFDIGAGIKGGLPLLPKAAELLKSRAAEYGKDNPDAHCLPLGLTQLHMHPQPRKMIQTPGLIMILYEAQGGIRQIFTDGRPLPASDAQPWWYGYSAGKWDGDTLVVETNGFRDDVWLDVNGSPLTNTGKMTERFRRTSFGNMEIDITIQDPSVYSKPFTVRVNQRIMIDTDLIEFVCGENERSVPHLVGK